MHQALSDPAVVERTTWHCDGRLECQIRELICRLSQKPYAPAVAAFWRMNCFQIAGPMEWTGKMFEGEATAFIQITEVAGGLIGVSFHDAEGATEPMIGGTEACERLVDALVPRILHKIVEQAAAPNRSLTPVPESEISVRGSEG